MYGSTGVGNADLHVRLITWRPERDGGAAEDIGRLLDGVGQFVHAALESIALLHLRRDEELHLISLGPM
jgi:hypothetical protein